MRGVPQIDRQTTADARQQRPQRRNEPLAMPLAHRCAADARSREQRGALRRQKVREFDVGRRLLSQCPTQMERKLSQAAVQHLETLEIDSDVRHGESREVQGQAETWQPKPRAAKDYAKCGRTAR